MKPMLRVTCVDLETGDEETRDVATGDYCIIAAWPLVVDGVVSYGNGTIVLTLKRAGVTTDDLDASPFDTPTFEKVERGIRGPWERAADRADRRAGFEER